MNASQLSSDLHEKVGVNPRQVLKYRTKLAKRGIYSDSNDFENKCSLRCVVIDMSAVSTIDASGVTAIREVVADFAQIDIPVYLANCSVIVYDVIHKCNKLDKAEDPFTTFATVHDAIFYAQRELVSKNV